MRAPWCLVKAHAGQPNGPPRPLLPATLQPPTVLPVPERWRAAASGLAALLLSELAPRK